VVALDTKITASSKELKAMVMARDSTLMDLTGVGPVVAARILADVGDVARFADRNRFASWSTWTESGQTPALPTIVK
jgi:transposase